jgi:Beta-propeller repeat
MKHFEAMNFLLFILGISFLLAACSSESVQGTLTRQDFGTASNDFAEDVAAPKGGVGAVVVGRTDGALDGVNKGKSDAFIRRYDGGVVWSQQFGTRGSDVARAVAVTSTGISYVLGDTDGALGFKVGSTDVFLRKYNAAGVVQWTRQFGTTLFDSAQDVTLDSSGNVYVLSSLGGTAFTIRKFSPGGTLLLTVTNTTSDIFNPPALAVDSTGNIFVLAPFVQGNGKFVRLFKYNSAGTLLASPNVFFGLGFLSPLDLVVDSSNNLYFSVKDTGANQGGFVRKVNNVGATLWTQRIEPAATGAVSSPEALALDSQGNVNVTGFTSGAYAGFTNAGGVDIFALQLNGATGARVWTRQVGGNATDSGNGIAVSDTVYVAGSSFSNPNLLGDPAFGGGDAFVAQLNRTSGAVLGIDQ